MDLQRSVASVGIEADAWTWNGYRYPYLEGGKERTIYHWTDGGIAPGVAPGFAPVARYTSSLVKLVPTDWGPPTFEIDGIKMLPTARVSPYADAKAKVNFIRPRGKVVLDTCGGLGYFAAWCLEGQAARVLSYEKNLDVIWLRGLNPWSPQSGAALTLCHADVVEAIATVPENSVDAVLHDPPRFGIAGELYSQAFYNQLARVMRRNGRLFHYTGSPNKVSSGRDVALEVMNRLRRAGFTALREGDGVLAIKARGS